VSAVRYRYAICDVFTDVRFGGNQLAVLPEAEGLSDEQMQRIAREFNFSETTFVLPAEAGNTRRVRIFTPSVEVPFAGHPNVGTAFALATAGELGEIGDGITVTFEEKAGTVPIAVRREAGGAISCELEAPQALSLGKSVSTSAVARAVSLAEDDFLTAAHPPQVASVGLPFVLAELRDPSALARARPRIDGFEALRAEGVTPDVHLYTRGGGEVDLRARMFAPLDGVPEDPATGSACCALAGLLAHLDGAREGHFRWRIAQGVEMGRPSLLDARAEKREGVVVSTRVGGACVLVAEGLLEVD
jgi:trans-2,3-dihydro-3-hydroxyanthranilate isomerase